MIWSDRPVNTDHLPSGVVGLSWVRPVGRDDLEVEVLYGP